MAAKPKTTTAAKTTKKRSTAKSTSKTATKAKTPASSAKSPAGAKPATIVTEQPVIKGPTLKKPALVDRVVEKSGLKKKDVKPSVEAALAVLGEAIANGEDLNLPGFGKLKVNRRKDMSNATVMICKLRQPKSAGETAGEDQVENDTAEALAKPEQAG